MYVIPISLQLHVVGSASDGGAGRGAGGFTSTCTVVQP